MKHCYVYVHTGEHETWIEQNNETTECLGVTAAVAVYFIQVYVFMVTESPASWQKRIVLPGYIRGHYCLSNNVSEPPQSVFRS